ncbi:MAG: class IV adenylate cyclase [Holophaga sp.]|nr:class IV adenylate cyclase [Holophaga sp.]
MEHHTRIETEVKLKVPSLDGLQARLEAMGFVLRIPPLPESSVLWDRGQELLIQGSALRLRRFAGKAWLTWKGPKIPDATLKIRPEQETEIADADAMERILQALGYTPVVRMVKTRAVLRRADLEACLDETPFGCYLELEGDAAVIHEAMATLGIGPEVAEPRSYPTLYREHGLA